MFRCFILSRRLRFYFFFFLFFFLTPHCTKRKTKKGKEQMNFATQQVALPEAKLARLIHEKNMILYQEMLLIPLKEKRRLLRLADQMVSEKQTRNCVFPCFFGITLGEFCIAQVLIKDNKRKFTEYIRGQREQRGV
jgi:hypothetical protein